MEWTDLIGPGLGLVGGYMGGKAGQDQTTTQRMSPEMQAQWNAYSGFANQVAGRPYQNTVAPFTQDQYGAMDQIRNNAQGGPEQQAASGAFQNFMKGPQGNPYLQGLVQQGQDQVMKTMNTGAFASGSFGNSGVAGQTAKALADSNNNLYNQQLNTQANLIPQGLNFQNQNLGNASALLQSGAMQQQQGQKTADQWWNYPQQQLDIMGKPLGLGQGSQTTQQGNPYASALGGGLLGLQVGSALGQTPPPRTNLTPGNPWSGYFGG
jgi:hypothetical protein